MAKTKTTKLDSPAAALTRRESRGSKASPRPDYSRWRAATLALVHLLFVAHFVHWRIRGETLAPLELNEAMYTLAAGIVTAGFLLMVAIALGTLVFGRFFCSWGCHILALQDLSRWILGKLGIRRPRPVRSRVLLFVPPLTVIYLVFWPQLQRILQGRPLPSLHLRTDADGLASFITTDFWRNLPGPWIAGLTFLVCGFVAVYVLGSRGFCTYACPYGAIFAGCDRLATGRIRVTEDCVQCATCTATCSSGVRVHEEVDRHGMVVDPSCLKDLDCIEACPEGALYFGWGRPALLKSRQSRGRFGGRYDFTLAEDLVMAVIFVVVLASFRGLYGVVPFLGTLGLAGIVAVLGLYALRLGTKVDVRWRSRFLKRRGRLTRSGWVYVGFSALLLAFVGHSAVIRFNEVRGLAWEPEAESARALTARGDAEASYAHLVAADRYGLVSNERVERLALTLSTYLGRRAESERWALSILQRHPDDAAVRLRLAGSLAARQRFVQAEGHFVRVADQTGADPQDRASAHLGLADILIGRREWQAATVRLGSAIDLAPQPAQTYAELGAALAELGLFARAQAALEEAISLEPDFGEAHYNLGTLQMAAGRFDEAVLRFQQALDSAPDDGATLNNLGLALERLGRVEEAIHHLERAITVSPRNADAHFNLARLLFAGQEEVRAVELLRTAAALDERYRQFLQ